VVFSKDNTHITDVIPAGTSVRLQIFALDAVKNPIKLSFDSQENGVNNFGISYNQDNVLYNLYDIKVDSENSYYYSDIVLTKAG